MVNCPFTLVRKRAHGLHLRKAAFKRSSDSSSQACWPASRTKPTQGPSLQIDPFTYSSPKAWLTHSYSVISSIKTSSLCRLNLISPCPLLTPFQIVCSTLYRGGRYWSTRSFPLLDWILGIQTNVSFYKRMQIQSDYFINVGNLRYFSTWEFHVSE